MSLPYESNTSFYHPPKELENFITESELQDCIDLYNKLPFIEPKLVAERYAGPSEFREKRKDFCIFNEEISTTREIFLPKFKKLFPDQEFIIDGGNFINWNTPVPIHTDGYQTQLKPIDSYLGSMILVPLSTDTGKGSPGTAFFDQYKFGPYMDPTQVSGFRNNRYISDGVINYTNKPFDKNNELYNQIDYFNQEWLYGFSIHSIIKWHYTSAIMWHRSQFHCSTKFENYSTKLHLVFGINFR